MVCWPLHLQEEVAKNLLAEFNLGCDIHQTEHVYRVYVATFLGLWWQCCSTEVWRQNILPAQFREEQVKHLPLLSHDFEI